MRRVVPSVISGSRVSGWRHYSGVFFRYVRAQTIAVPEPSSGDVCNKMQGRQYITWSDVIYKPETAHPTVVAALAFATRENRP